MFNLKIPVQLSLRPALLMVAVLTLLLSSFGPALMQPSAQASSVSTHQVKLINPGSCTGWEASNNALKTNLLTTSQLEKFNKKNSATKTSQSSSTTGSVDTTLADPSQTLVCGHFIVPPKTSGTAVLTNSSVRLSLAIAGAPLSEDVVTVEAGVGEAWQQLDSLVMVADQSNGTHTGYWTYNLSGLTLIDLEHLQIRVRYHGVPTTEKTTVYVDGITVVADIGVPGELPDEAIELSQTTYSAEEQPVFDVVVHQKSFFSFLGATGTHRAINTVELIDPDGRTIDPKSTVQQSDDAHGTQTYAINPAYFTRPGKYSLKLTVTENGVPQTVTRDFSWGVLVMNTDQAEYHRGQTARFGFGVLDDHGNTICDASLQLQVIAPSGDTQSLSTDAGSISYSDECGPQSVTPTPDYGAEAVLAEPGTYHTVLTATTASGSHTITGEISVRDDIPFVITRYAPTRIYPKANYTMYLEIVPTADYSGPVYEELPNGFTLAGIDSNGRLETTPNTQTIVWDVDWLAGQTYTLGYVFDAPDISPEIFRLGPVTVSQYVVPGSDPLDATGWTEPRQWQMASDAVSYTGKAMHTVEYLLGGDASGTAAVDNTTRATNVSIWAGTSWSNTSTTTGNCGVNAGCKNVVVAGSGIRVVQAYLDVGFHHTGGNNDLTDVDATLDVEGSATAGTHIRIGQTSGVILQDRGSSDLTSDFSAQYDATALFDRQTDTQFNNGLDVVASVTHTGGSRALTWARLVLTYESDYSTSSHQETKTVRFPLNSDTGTDEGSMQGTASGSTAYDFSYTSSLPDLTTSGDIKDVYVEFHAEVNTTSNQFITPRHNNNGTLGTNGPAYAFGDALAGDENLTFFWRLTVGTNDFNPTVTTTNQKVRFTMGTAAANVLGGELVVTYNYNVTASTQVDTVQYYMKQQTASTAGTKTTDSAVSTTISNTGRSVKNIWYKAYVGETESNQLTIYGTVGGGSERSNAYTVGGSNTVRVGFNQVIYFDLSQDVANYSSATTNLDAQVQWTGGTPGTGDAPVGIEAYITFEWSGSSGGTQTVSLKYARAHGGAATAAAEYYNVPLTVSLNEEVAKTYRDAYVVTSIGNHQTGTTTFGTVNVGVDMDTSGNNSITVTEATEEGTTTTGEGYQMTILYDVGSTVFSGGSSIGWKSRVFEISGSISVANETYRSNQMVVTYDAAFGDADPQGQTVNKATHTVEYILGSNASGTAATDNSSRTTTTTGYAGSSWSTTSTTTGNCGVNAGCKNVVIAGSHIKVLQASLDVGFHINTAGGNNDLTDVDASMDVEGSVTAGTHMRIGQTSGLIFQDRAASDLTSDFSAQYDATALFDRQSDSAFNNGLDVVASIVHTGGTRSLTSARLIITYESDYSTASHQETKTVRFPLNSDGSGDEGSTQAACATTTACDFSYTSSLPDLSASGDIKDVFVEVHAEINSTTASTITPRHNNNGTLGTNGPSYGWVDAVAGDTNISFFWRPTVGTNDFNPTVTTTNQKIRLTTGSVAANILGGELVVTYNYDVTAATQVDTVQYFMKQQTSATANTKTTDSAVSTTISNTGRAVKNIWYKAFVGETETNTLTIYGTVGGGSERSNAYVMGGSNTIRAGNNQVIYFDLSQDVANYSSATTNLDAEIQWTGGTPGTGDAPVGIEAYITFEWSGSSGGTQTSTVKYTRAYGGAATVGAEYYNAPLSVTLAEDATKTYRDAYVLSMIGNHQASSITVGTVTIGVDMDTGSNNGVTVTEASEEGTTTTAEGYQMTLLYDVGSTVFSGGSTIGWKSRVFEVTGALSVSDETYRSNTMVVTYDAAHGTIALSQNHFRWRDDTTALNTDGGWSANQDNVPTISKSTTYRLRVEVANTGGAPAVRYPYQLEVAAKSGTCAASSFSAVVVTPTTEHFEMVTSGQYVDQASLTASRLTATGTFTNGLAVEDPSNNTNAITITNGYYTELEYAVQATTNATDGGTYCFRVTNLGSTTNFTYSTYAEATIVVPGITVSGGCFTDATEGSACTDDGSDQIRVAVNGTLDSNTDTVVDGSWSLTTSSVPSNGAILTIFRDGESTESEEAATIIKYDGSGNVDQVKLYQSTLIIGADAGSANSDQTIANSDMDPAGNGYDGSDDEDVLYTYSSGTLAVTGSRHLYVISGDTYRPEASPGNDTVTTSNLTIDSSAALTADSNSVTVAGSFTNGGTFTAGTSTLTMNGSGTFTSGGATINNLTLSGTITLANATHAIGGNLDLTGGTITAGSSTVAMSGTSKTVTTGTATLNNFTVSGGSITSVGAFAASGTFQITGGTFTQATTGDMTLTGDTVYIANGATFTKSAGSAKLIMDGVSDNQTFEDANTTKNDLGHVQIGASPGTTKLKSDFSATDLTIPTGDTFETHGWEVDLSDFLDCQGTCTLTLTDNAPNNEGDGTIITFGGAYTMSSSGTFTPSTTSTVTPDGTANQTITTGGKAFYNFVTNNTGSGGSDVLTISGNLTVNGALTVTDGNLQLTTNDPTTVVAGNVTIGASGTLTASDSASFTASANWDNNGTFTHSSGTITLDAADTDNTIECGSSSFSGLTLQGSDGSGTWTFQTDDCTIAALLNVDTSDIATINSGRTITLSGNSGTTLTFNGTINGPGRLTYQNSATTFPTSGTIAATLITRFDTVNGAMNIPARTDYGAIEAYGASANARTITLGTATSQTITTSSYFYVMAEAASPNDVTVTGATYTITMNVGGTLDFTGAGSADEVLTTGNGTWTVSGSANFSGGTLTTTTSSTLVMNGSGTLTTGGDTLGKLTLSGTITLANETINLQGNALNMTGGTITAGTSSIVWSSTASTLTGGGNTLYDLTWDVAALGRTLTVSGSDVTISNALGLGQSETISISSGITMSVTGSSNVTCSATPCTVSGAGTLRFVNTSGGPGTDITLSSVVRFDATAGNIATTTVDARTYSGAVEFYSNVAAVRSISVPSGSFTFSSSFSVITGASQSSVLTVDASINPTVGITGDLTYTQGGSATPAITTGTGTWTVAGNVNLSNGTFTATAGNTLVMSGTSKTLTSNSQTLQNLTLSGTITLANATHTINGNLVMSNTVTPGTSTVVMTGTSNTITPGGFDLNNLTIDPSSAGTITLQTSDLRVLGNLSVATGDVLSINSGRILNLFGQLTLDGTISGAGTLGYKTTVAFPTSGTISSILRMDTTDATNLILSQRTYGGRVVVYNNHATVAGTVTLGTAGSQTLNFSSDLVLDANGAANVTLIGTTWDPTVNVTGDLDFVGTGGGTEIITAPDAAATWTVSGNVDFTSGTYTTSAETLVMNGTSKTLTSASQTLHNVTLSGSITLANATHTINGNLDMTGGTITAGTSTVTMTGTSNTITGGGATLANLTIDPSSAGTITLQTSDLTVSATLTVAASDALTLNSGRTLTLSGNSGTTLSLSGTINGPGRLTYQNTATTFPTGGTLASTLITRFDTLNGNMVVPARTDYGAIEAYGGSANARTVTLGTAGSQTITTSSYLYVIADASSPNDVTLQGATWDPTLNIGGTLDFTGVGSASEKITAPDAAATWSIAGNVDFTGGTYTPGAETIRLNGSSTQTVTSASQSIYNLTLTNTSGSFTGCTSPMTTPGIDFADGATVTNNYTITTQNVKVEYNAGSTYTFQNVNWNGVATDGIVFRSSTTAVWYLTINGTQTDVSYVSVAYSDATGTSGGVNASNGTNTNCGNDVNWTFTTGITVSGGCFTDETEGTPCTDDGSDQIKVAINGVVEANTDTTVDGSWSFSTSSAPPSGAIMVFFRDGEATASEEATTVVKYDGTGDVDLVKMYQSQLVIGTDSGSVNTDQTITAADLDTASNGYENSDDEDVLYDYTAGADITVDAEANKTEQLYIINGDTYRPAAGGGSDTTTENLAIDTSATITADSNAFYVSGNWSNNGTFAAGTGTVFFIAGDAGNTIAGTLNGSSAFYKVDFDDPSGSDATWTVNNAMKVSAANNSATYVIHDGTVTQGNGTGDDLEVDGAMNIAIGTGETGTFQTYSSLDQTASETITIDLNNNASPASCSNCIITVGANQVTGAGNFKLAKNVTLRLNPYVSGPTDTGLQVLSNGYLEVKGSQDATATSTATDSAALQETTTCATGLVSANDVHNNKVLRYTSGLAYGRIYDITDTIDQDPNCATNTDDSVIRTANDSADSTIASITTLGPTRKICAAGAGMITADNEGIGRYLRDQTDSTFYLIVDSTNNDATCSSNDSFVIYSNPDSFSSLATSETIDVTDGTKPTDTFEVLDYAAVTGENGTACTAAPGGAAEGYIYAGQGSKNLIQYALICDLGRNTSPKYGLYFENIDGSFAPNDGVDVRDAKLQDLYEVRFIGSDNHSSANGLGVRDSDISEMDYYEALVLGSSSDNNYLYHNRVHNNANGGIGCIFGSCGQNNVVDSNYVYANGAGGGSNLEFYDNNNTISNNYSFSGPQYGIYLNDSLNTISGNYFFGDLVSGAVYVNGKNNILSSNTILESPNRAIYLVGGGNSVVGNTLTAQGQPLRVDSSSNVVYNNSIYVDGSQQVWLQNAAGNIFGHNTMTGNTSVGNNDALLFNSTAGSGSSNNVFVGDTYDGFRLGTYVQGSVANTNNRFINDQFGASTTNSLGDLYIAGSAQGHTERLLNTKLNSSTEVYGGVSTTGAYIFSRKHDQTAGSTKIWGEYSSITDIAETPQNEGTEQYNYANVLYPDSVTAHSYTVGAGAGSEDSNLEFAFSGGSLGGDGNDYVYRVMCNVSNCVTSPTNAWNVYRNGTLLSAKASTGSTYTDSQVDGGSAPNVQFKIDDAGTDYTQGATYLFAAYKGSSDTNQQKTITMMQDGDLYTNTASTTLQLKGQSYQTNTTNITRNASGGYSFAINGAIDADNYNFQYLGGTGQASGLDINTGATVTSLARGSFSNFATNVSSADAFIDIDSSVISTGTPQVTIPNTTFTNGNGNASCNVNATGTALGGYIEFTKQYGPFGGESNDCDDGAADGDPGQIKWTPPYLTFSISDVSVGFGSLSSSVARFATANEAGADGPTPTSAHTMQVATNGDYGYLLSYFSSATLANNTGASITAATITGDADGSQNTEQFALGITTDGSATVATAYSQASSNYKFETGSTVTLATRSTETTLETLTAYYLGNIAALTEAGAYSTSITYIVTGTF